MDQPMPRSELRVGMTVAYLGNERDVLNWGQQPVVGILRAGHPGRVWESHHGQHVLAHWVGLEETDESQVVGYSTDDAGAAYPGLTVIVQAEYLRRVERLASGW